MAEKSVKTAKSTKKTKVEKVSLVGKSLEDLKKDLTTKQNDILEARRGHRAGELINPRVITLTRKEIARIKTAIRAAELKEKSNG
jgi:large subunit ribosomal protein L29